MFLVAILLLIVTLTIQLSDAFTPLNPTNGYIYYIEAVRELAWPSCAYRFLSYTSTCNAKIDLWNAAGVNQRFLFISTGDGDDTFYLKSSCGTYLSYPDDCSNTKTIDFWAQAGINQKFRFVKGNNVQYEYYIEAVGRSQCASRYMSFPVGCTTSGPDTVDFWSAAGPDQRFRLYPVSSLSPVVHNIGSNFVCPDPYVWKPKSSNEYLIQCTGGGLKLGSSQSLDPSTGYFTYKGDCLGGIPAQWASISYGDSRWAPENYEAHDGNNYLFFSDSQSSDNNNHRIGWVLSNNGPNVNQYTKYASNYMNLGMAAGGDIDGTIFEDSDGRTYLVWKTDDNAVGSKTTRIWAQELSFANQTVAQISSPRIIMDSTGLWWIDSWVNGGSLVEGPEVVKYNNMYYLFFAAGKFCQDTYTEGVARSNSLFGPYEKLGSPLLTNGIVGVAKTSSGSQVQLVGPGHATIVNTAVSSMKDSNNLSSSWRIVWHASVGENCDRYPFISELVFGADGWPYVNF